MAATAAEAAVEKATDAFRALQTRHDETVPVLERDKARAEKRAEKFESMARKMEHEWREEKAMNESLMQRVSFLSGQVERIDLANKNLEEQNRDLTFFISGSERLKGADDDVVQGTVGVPEEESSGRRKKGKGKGKKK